MDWYTKWHFHHKKQLQDVPPCELKGGITKDFPRNSKCKRGTLGIHPYPQLKHVVAEDAAFRIPKEKRMPLG